MRMPIKLNERTWPRILTALIPSSDDPRGLIENGLHGEQFSKLISVFKFGNTFKTTKSLRFPATLETIASLQFETLPVVLDVGASDGMTSLDVIRRIPFKKYYVTDLNVDIFYDFRDGTYYFYDTNFDCILVTTKWFVVYSDIKGSLFPFGLLVKYFFSKSVSRKDNLIRLELINPEVKKLNGNVIIAKYDIFKRWTREKVDLVLVANLLNSRYFTNQQIINAVQNMIKALKEGGRLVIVENRGNEQGTIFRIEKRKIYDETNINGGTEIRNLILHAGLK